MKPTEPLGVLIPTRKEPARAEFLAQIPSMLAEQTMQADVVYQVDDTPKGDGVDIGWRVKLGLERARRDGIKRVLIWEDDTYYTPDYIASMKAAWDPKAWFVCNNSTVAYHLGLRQWRLQQGAGGGISFHTYGLRTDILDRCPPLPDDRRFVDSWFFNRVRDQTITDYQKVDLAFVNIDMKHGLGLCGSDMHVDSEHRLPYTDPKLSYLRRFVVSDSLFEFYAGMSERLREDQMQVVL
jgi:hypothetical protein